MSLPLRSLPVLEKYDCHGCGDCCYGTIIHLRDEDLRKIREQRWEEHPDYRGQKILVREGLFGKQYQLAKRGDGGCIFLTPERRCRIHQEFGYEAKPLICQIAPLQVVPLDQFAYVTVRRYCRSAVRDHGRDLAEHLDELSKKLEKNAAGPRPTPPPAITPHCRRPWKDTFCVTDAIARLMLDTRYPLVRRLVHGIEFCNLLDHCSLRRLERPKLLELVGMFEEGAVQEAGAAFRERVPPKPRAARLYRQTALEYFRLHPRFVPERSFRERLRLISAALAFARGKGPVPQFRLPFPECRFEDLERPLGRLDEAVLRPINAYFETIAASLRFAVLGRPNWAITESFYALALSYSIAMWVLRMACGQLPPTEEQACEVTMLLDRSQGYAPLVGARHRLRVNLLARLGELSRLAAWYAR